MKTPEQEARDILESLGVENAQNYTSGDLVELANHIANSRAYLKSWGKGSGVPSGKCKNFSGVFMFPDENKDLN